MSDSISTYRQLSVLITPSRFGTAVAVVARHVHGGHRRDNLLLRFHVDTVYDVDTVASVLRCVADELMQTADRL